MSPSSTSIWSFSPQVQMDMDNFKLVHHYSLVTSTTLNVGSPASLYTNQFVVPSIAFKEPTFMHVLLALSSLHLHILYSPLGIADRDYLRLAQRHRAQALSLFTSLPTTSSPITSYSALTPTSTQPSDTRLLIRNFLVIYAVAESLGAIAQPQGVFTLIDNIRTSLRDKIYFYQDEQLKPLIWPFLGVRIVPTEAEEEESALGSGMRVFPRCLKYLHLPQSAYRWPNAEEVSDPKVSMVYQAATSTLREQWYISQFNSDTGLVSATAWIFLMSDAFREYLVAERRPRALVVLYFYCVMLGNLDQQKCWWAAKHVECLKWIEGVLEAEWMEMVRTTVEAM
ncbi:hypothetical protein VNI00_008545 [Paramarasmius palmivorus]|uniref:Uncharacterized protein n=1 Tax=Paramarasmius palmivorus TaxID=297713 RepID=A0AAW0CTG6_9AGAR